MVTVDEFGLFQLGVDEYMVIFDNGGDLVVSSESFKRARAHVGGYVVIKTEHANGRYMAGMRVIELNQAGDTCHIKVLPFQG